MKKINNLYFTALLFGSLCLFGGCKQQAPRYEVTSISGTSIPMTSQFDSLPDPQMDSVIQIYKKGLDEAMNKKVGESALFMDVRRPQSLLSNLTADILRSKAAEYCKQDIDFAIINIGGIRTSLDQGEVTYGDIFSIFPFENKLSVVTLKGSAVNQLMEQIAKVKGEGVSCEVNLKITSEGKISELLIGGKTVDENRLYRIATINYLADGNDGLSVFRKAEDRIDLEQLLRETVLEYVEEQQAAGKPLTSSLDKRIVIEK